MFYVLYLITSRLQQKRRKILPGSAWGESLCSEYDPFLLSMQGLQDHRTRFSINYLLFSIFDVHPMTNGLHSQYIPKNEDGTI
jgi:hypothetical protein